MIHIYVPGVPQPQGSKRAFVTKTGRANIVESTAKVRPWRSDVKVFAAEAMTGLPLLTGAVRIRLGFVMKRPASTPKTRPTPPAIKKPDLDKLTRAVLDALSGTVYGDDALVVEIVATKRIAEPDEQPGVDIMVGAK